MRILKPIKDLVLLVKEIAEKLGLIADYVVEQGTSGNWNYRKWNSGIAECWGIISKSTGEFTSHGIGVYYMTRPLGTNLPTGIFETVSHAIPTMLEAGGGVLLPRVINVNVSAVAVDFVRIYGGSDSLDVQYAIEVKGRWK